MKNEITAKINKVGKVSRIVSRIMQGILLATAIVIPLCILMVCFVMPSDSLKIDGTAQGRISHDTKSTVFNFKDMESDHTKFFGAELNVDVEETADSTEKNVNNIDVSASAKEITGKQVKIFSALLGFIAELYLVSMYIIFMFAVKLCKALEVCQSPFETEVLTAMKKLGFSFIPYGVVSIVFEGISALSVIIIFLFVLMFVYVFNYGAELQQESDDTV